MSGQLVEVRKYLGRQEAEVARAMLIGCGIPAEVFADNEGNMAPHLAIVTAARLMVPEDFRREALAILTDRDSGAQDISNAEPDSAAELQEAHMHRAIHRVYVAAVFGAVIIPVLSQIYSLWLAREPLSSWTSLSSTQKTKLGVAVAANVAVLAFALWLVLKLTGN